MNKDVIAVVAGDKAKALVCIKPFDAAALAVHVCVGGPASYRARVGPEYSYHDGDE